MGAAGCADSGAESASGDRVIVAAAASLEPALTSLAPRARTSFSGSGAAAARVRAGARPDVVVLADRALAERLHAERLVEPPVVVAANRLVLAVRSGSALRTLDDVASAGRTLALGARGVPAGDVARRVIAGLPPAQRRALRDAVRSEEPDVAGVAGKVLRGAVDAAFVYASDVRAAGGELRAIALPAAAPARVAIAAAVVRDAPDPAAARAFVARLRGPDGRRALRAAGFLPPP